MSAVVPQWRKNGLRHCFRCKFKDITPSPDMGVAKILIGAFGVLCMMLWRLFSSISLMRSAFVVRTRFILNILVGLDWGVPGPQDLPLGYAHVTRCSR